MTSLNNIVYNNELSYQEKYDDLGEILTNLNEDRTSSRKYLFDYHYKFSEDFDSLTPNQKGKELTLAFEIIKLKKYGNEDYHFRNLKEMLDTTIEFRLYFKPYCNIGKIKGKNFYKNGNKASIRELIKGTNLLVDSNLISKDLANTYFKYLEAR